MSEPLAAPGSIASRAGQPRVDQQSCHGLARL